MEEGQSPKQGNESKMEIKPIMFSTLLQNGGGDFLEFQESLDPYWSCRQIMLSFKGLLSAGL